MEFTFFLAAFIVLCIGAAIFAWRAAEKRRKALEAFAADHGLAFDPDPDPTLIDRFSGMAPFDRGSDRRVSNRIHGRRGEVDWELFDYRYTTGSGKNRRTHHFGVVVACVPLLFPRMTLRAEGLFDKVASLVGYDDINFESHEFSSRYHVSGADRKRCYDLIHPRMIEFLMTLPRYHWQFDGNRIVIHLAGSQHPQTMADIMSAIGGFLERIPDYVRKDIGFRPANA